MPLLASAKIDVLDTAWAEVHVGIFGLNYDIFRAELCYKGGIEYGLNILKVRQIRRTNALKWNMYKLLVTIFFCSGLTYGCNPPLNVRNVLMRSIERIDEIQITLPSQVGPVL